MLEPNHIIFQVELRWGNFFYLLKQSDWGKSSQHPLGGSENSVANKATCGCVGVPEASFRGRKWPRG